MDASGTIPSGPVSPEKAWQSKDRKSKDGSVEKFSTRMGTASVTFTAMKHDSFEGYGSGNPGLMMQSNSSIVHYPLTTAHMAPLKSTSETSSSSCLSSAVACLILSSMTSSTQARTL